MIVQGIIGMSRQGAFVIQTPLLQIAKELREAFQADQPDKVVCELETNKPYTINGVPLVFKMKPKTKKKGS